MRVRYVLLEAARYLIVRCLLKYQLLFQIWDYLVRVNRVPWNFSRSRFEYCFCVLFWKKPFRSTLDEEFNLTLLSSFIVSIWILNTRSSHFVFLGARARFQGFLLKNCFSVLALNSIEVNDSRLISGKQFHLIVTVSFLFRIQI